MALQRQGSLHAYIERANLKRGAFEQARMTPLAERIDQLLSTQLVGVLATQQCSPPLPDQPYTSLMAFAHTPDLHFVLIATRKDTQKHANLLHNASLSLLIDNRGNTSSDYQKAVAISVTGSAEVIPAIARDALHALFLSKHPELRLFVEAPGCALLRIRVARYSVVSQFQATESLELAADEGLLHAGEAAGA